MGRIGGTRSGNAPTVDSNAKSGAGTSPIDEGWGSLPPYPNLSELPPERPKPWEFKPSVKADAARQDFVAKHGEIGKGRDDYRNAHNTIDLPVAQPVVTNNVEPSQASGDNSSSVEEVVIQDARKTTEGERLHDKQVAEDRKDNLKQLHQQIELSTSGTTAPAA